MKKAFFLLELVIVILLMGIFYSLFNYTKYSNKLDEVASRILIYLNYTRYIALIDDKYSETTDKNGKNLWYKQRWTMKFMNCNKSKGGIYFRIYSETNDTGHAGKEESLRDPLTNKYIYAHNDCKIQDDRSPFTLLANYDIKDVQISCNSTDSIGQISFGNDGKVYSKINSLEGKEVTKPCIIKLISTKNQSREIVVNPTGLAHFLH